ncbi:cysteine hydrolase family protein [Pseudofrankia inefficax]|uniref:Isochorismatase hydrolase n=1 Tax=Pseudofrankia inefficax (strain DSM 45817 / CECT 9037 / DDB 130130 / EuI1c) TaxID=298654 RepID=E3IZB5_PSEI1|nr:cysteine hydrolase family protein [Pseudofrankia inefficax]ADP81542.1 isochorismatase hydrolase [Pseudofrankia inefficax]
MTERPIETTAVGSVRRALVVIDVQNEYDADGALPIAHPPFAVAMANVTAAMDAARESGVPVVVIQHDAPADSPLFAVGSSGWELHPAVGGRPRDALFRKTLPGSFTGTGLEAWLRAHAIDTLTVVGFMTHWCVDTTTRQAVHAGFSVEVLADATGTIAYANSVGTLDARQMHERALTVLHGGMAAVGTTEAWLAALRGGGRLPASSLPESALAATAV